MKQTLPELVRSISKSTKTIVLTPQRLGRLDRRLQMPLGPSMNIFCTHEADHTDQAACFDAYDQETSSKQSCTSIDACFAKFEPDRGCTGLT